MSIKNGHSLFSGSSFGMNTLTSKGYKLRLVVVSKMFSILSIGETVADTYQSFNDLGS